MQIIPFKISKYKPLLQKVILLNRILIIYPGRTYLNYTDLDRLESL
ncbi:MAG: hypothetical protein ACP5U0_01150 [Caldisphaera sp.]